MKRAFISIFLTAFVLTAGAQKKCGIKKAWAFYTATMPGMAMADENGNIIPPKPIIGRFIYIECVGTAKPEIGSVLYNNRLLEASLTKVENVLVIPGGDIDNNKNYRIRPQKNNSLWKIDLQPPGGDPMPAPGCRNIVIKTRNKTCSFKLSKETKLSTMPTY